MLLGPNGDSCLEVSIMNSTVQKGEHFEVWAVQFLPNLIANGFRGVSCGYKVNKLAYIDLTTWDFFRSPPGMRVITPLPLDYVGRVSVHNLTIMRINNAQFMDDGRDFFCKLSYANLTTGKDFEMFKVVKVEAVYGKQKLFFLLTIFCQLLVIY